VENCKQAENDIIQTLKTSITLKQKKCYGSEYFEGPFLDLSQIVYRCSISAREKNADINYMFHFPQNDLSQQTLPVVKKDADTSPYIETPNVQERIKESQNKLPATNDDDIPPYDETPNVQESIEEIYSKLPETSEPDINLNTPITVIFKCPRCDYSSYKKHNLERHFQKSRICRNKHNINIELTEENKDAALNPPKPPRKPRNRDIDKHKNIYQPRSYQNIQKLSPYTHQTAIHSINNTKNCGFIAQKLPPCKPTNEKSTTYNHIFKCPRCDYSSYKKHNLERHFQKLKICRNKNNIELTEENKDAALNPPKPPRKPRK